jgi:UPF0755 protein
LVAIFYFFSSDTNFSENNKVFYIKTNSSLPEVVDNLVAERIVKNPTIFKWIAKIAGYEKKVRPGKYLIEKGSSIYSIVKKLRRGNQTAINLVINKLRTKEDFAKKIGGNFECDSANFMAILSNNDSLKKYELDSNTVMSAVIPNTYQILWNTSASGILKKLHDQQGIFWNDERRQKAKALNLSPTEAYTLASIVEEETIDAILNSPPTSYLFFVAKPDLKGFSNFSTTYKEHLRFAKEYQKALDSFMNLKQTP